MNVLVFTGDRGIPLYGPGGCSAHLRGVTRAYDALGCEVRVAVPRLSDHRGAVEDPVGAPVIAFEPRAWGWLGPWRERGERWDARRLMADALDLGDAPDLLHERHALFSDAGGWARRVDRWQGTRLVELNAPLCLERARASPVRDDAFASDVERDSLRSADRVCAVSGWLARWAIEEAGCEPTRVRHVPNGVEDRGRGDRDRMRKRVGLDGLTLGFLGSLRPWHGVERIPAILDALPEATCIVVGDGNVDVPTHPRLRALGRVPHWEVPHLVAAMDVGMAPYRMDAPPWFCPLKILEYRAQSVPVVAADIGDCRALVGDGGEVLQTDDPQAWADAVRRQSVAPRRPVLRTWRDVVRESVDGLPEITLPATRSARTSALV